MTSPTPFRQALDQYIASLPEKKKKREFIVHCCAEAATPEDINEAIKRVEEKSTEKSGRKMVKRILSPVVSVLRDYDGLINSLASADPMPTALIWGALKVVVDGTHRFFGLFETIKKELLSLVSQLQRINMYDDLYGDSPDMQKLLCQSFINMLRFWSRVDKECNSYGFTVFLKSAASFSTKKLDTIIQDIEEDADQIEKLASILEANLGRDERKAAELERFRQERERVAAQKERDAQAAFRDQHMVDREEERYRRMCEWLCARPGNEDNLRHLRTLGGQRMDGTCNWILEHQSYLDWCSGSGSRVLWVRAPPATGKSVLSSHVIGSTTQRDADAVVVYHFYRFDQMQRSSEVLRILAGQLLDAHWARAHTISENMLGQTQQNVCSTDHLHALISLLLNALPKVYFILDGLDEECSSEPRWLEADATLSYLLKLASEPETLDKVRVWYSSQPRHCLDERLKANSTIIEAQVHTQADVARYLHRDNPELRDLEVSDADKDQVLESLQERAEANFLWASLMLRSLKTRNSLSDMKQFVADGLPGTLDGYYRKIFDHFDRSYSERSLISKIFALVVFARRPLRLGEIREALGLLLGKNSRSLDSADIPFISRLRTLLPPLIEFQRDGCSDPDDCTCRLFHSTVREFLVKNPEVLQAGLVGGSIEDVLIGPAVLANVCLRYLCQERYARPLRKRDGRWIDASGGFVDQHRFHLYSAKYWDKHLDDAEPSEELYERVSSFILSPNFQTCVQTQSLWVDSQFGVFCYPSRDDGRVYLRRMFPAWFVVSGSAGLRLWSDFRAFIHEWKYFLHSPTACTSTSAILPYVGELDRCWWPTLGPRNFLSRFKCKYTTFAFLQDGLPTNGGWHYREGVSEDGRELISIALVSSSHGAFTFECNIWKLSGTTPPRIHKQQHIKTSDQLTNWRNYVAKRNQETTSTRVSSIAFSSCNNYLRIGTQLFMRNSNDEYEPIVGFDGLANMHVAGIEEFAVRGNIVAVASRRHARPIPRYTSGLPDDNLEFVGFDFLRVEGAHRPAWIESRHDQEADDEDESESDSDSESDEGGYETWSEGSTELSDTYEYDVITPWAGPMSDTDSEPDPYASDDESEGSSKSSVVDSLKDEDQDKDESNTSAPEDKSDSEEEDLPPSAVVNWAQFHEDDDDYQWSDSDSDSDAPRIRKRQPKTYSRSTAFLEIFAKGADGPTSLFHFTKSLPFPLYNSPPVFHPTKSLVVWPLSAGDVIFVDYVAKTYFIRKLRPSTQHTRQIFMKCYFSPDGSYVHFACLEGQKKPIPRVLKKIGFKDTFKMALLVSTYRLSSRKTTRSPPILVHRARLALGVETTLSVAQLPFTLTWTPKHLYFTRSTETLRVARVSLFPGDKNAVSDGSISVPRKPILLPESATRRAVHFFPARDSDPAILLLGSESRGETHPNDGRIDDQLPGKQNQNAASIYSIKNTMGLRSSPIGCYLKEEGDFGGWCKSQDASKLPNDLGIGQLDHRLEKFDPEDDCDLEPYFR
ncbi:hypothetical protein HMN09_00887500 [Mycena chlorophos]|uniref:NACHT domain-containing protein n=1 Tax=Mycena chlorophos TaxID=658473 RepID=A0A8H6SPT6_MYCCL|nr:hypothetical protein HMN09_00887500 [Mycena chlorophos]